MSSNKERDAIFAQRAGAAAGKGQNHPPPTSGRGIPNIAGHIRESGRHADVIRQANLGRTNKPKGK
jgi:hypothetical protein